MIDIHSHVIPGVDDGSETMDSTISLISEARSQGATAFFATSHSEAFIHDGEEAFRKYADMKRTLQKAFPDVQVYLGCEVLCRREEMENIGQKLHDGVIPTMNDTAHVLAEFIDWADPETIKFCVSDLLQRGWIPILAHIERYELLTERMDLIDALRDMGCLLQLNVYSLESIQKERSRDWARRLILEQKADFLGTDMHGFRVRMPSITQGMLWLEENCDREYLEAITWRNAEEKLIRKERNSGCATKGSGD